MLNSAKYDNLSVFRSSVFGFIFLFKWSKELSEKEVVEQFTDDPTVFFAKQVTILYNFIFLIVLRIRKLVMLVLHRPFYTFY